MTAIPTAVSHPDSGSSHISSAPTRPLAGLGIPELFPTSNPSTQTPRRISREPSPHPANATEQAARPAPPRPLGDNAFAQSGRFKKQKPKPRLPVKDVFEDPVDPIFLELPFLPPSPVQDVTDIETWIDQRVARGAKEWHVLNALHCASMDPERADKVLEYLTAGKGIPSDMPGVWTAEDDECVQAMEHSRVQRALTKHGAQAYQERWEFLNMARDSEIIE
jgi:telomeric repeat-binding factor 2-interacting protein 1